MRFLRLIMANNKRKGRTRIKLDAKKIALAKQLILREATTTVIANELNISRTFAWRLRKSLVNGVSLHERVIESNGDDTPATVGVSESMEQPLTELQFGESIAASETAIKSEQNVSEDENDEEEEEGANKASTTSDSDADNEDEPQQHFENGGHLRSYEQQMEHVIDHDTDDSDSEDNDNDNEQSENEDGEDEETDNETANNQNQLLVENSQDKTISENQDENHSNSNEYWANGNGPPPPLMKQFSPAVAAAM